MSKKAAACRCKEKECEECPEWIFTFADLVMLMMGFFVILWVLKPSPTPTQAGQGDVALQTEDWLATVGEIKGAFGWEPDPQSTNAIDRIAIKRRTQNGPGERGKLEQPTKGAEGTDPEVTSIRQGRQATVGGRMIFDKGDAHLTVDIKKQLDQVAQEIRGHRNIVLVKGHTSMDDLPDTANAQQKMDLSLRRAQAVADYLIGRSVEPEILRVQGCSNFEPVLQRAYQSEAQANNRRVEVDATATLVEDLQDQSAAKHITTNSAPQESSESHH
ncbi:MAG TPA: OmpA family protein [Tepidisphaeraceae bacterium]|jgi:outer membrane protein OmpA-like peptidoglycan-associated protein|nr:OmpA family protein [Tepidisphaeraceae bacterium]